MQFLKQHYEKIILSVVLLVLALTAVWLPMEIGRVKDDLGDVTMAPARPKAFQPVEMEAYQGSVQRMQNPPEITLAGGHNLFNPVTWQRQADGTLIKIQTGKEVGPDALQITRIYPLRLIIRFDRAAGEGYWFKVTDETRQPWPAKTSTSKYAKVGDATDLFSLREIKGPPESPTEFVIQLNDSGQTASLTPDQPFERVEGYGADLRYDPENATFTDRRVSNDPRRSTIRIRNEFYKVVAIDRSTVTVSANLTQKRTTIRWKETP